MISMMIITETRMNTKKSDSSTRPTSCVANPEQTENAYLTDRRFSYYNDVQKMYNIVAERTGVLYKDTKKTEGDCAI